MIDSLKSICLLFRPAINSFGPKKKFSKGRSSVHYVVINRNVGAKFGSIVTRATGSTGRGSSQLIR